MLIDNTSRVHVCSTLKLKGNFSEKFEYLFIVNLQSNALKGKLTSPKIFFVFGLGTLLGL